MAKAECVACVWVKATGTLIDDSKTHVEWADIIGVAETSIRRHRKHAVQGFIPEDTLPANAKWSIGDSDFEGDSPATDSNLTVDDVRKFIISKGLNPDEWDYTWRFSEWEQSSKVHGVRTLHAFKVSGKRKAVKAGTIDLTELPDSIAQFTYTPAERKPEGNGSLILCATDFQLGKTDWNGGTKDTVEQVLTSFHRALWMAQEHNVDEVVIVDAGDIIENFYNTSSQRQTNDASLPAQVVAATQLMLEGIRLIGSQFPVRYVAVPSNHGRDRMGMQAPSGDVHDDWGLVVAQMVGIAAGVDVTVPGKYHDSLAFDASGTRIGVTHSDKAGSPDKLGNWWMGQSHGEMPTAHADILLCGHWHSLRVQQSGNKKWIIVGSASDRGSSWFTNARGEQSVSGVTAFVTRDGLWHDLRVL